MSKENEKEIDLLKLRGVLTSPLHLHQSPKKEDKNHPQNIIFIHFSLIIVNKND